MSCGVSPGCSRPPPRRCEKRGWVARRYDIASVVSRGHSRYGGCAASIKHKCGTERRVSSVVPRGVDVGSEAMKVTVGGTAPLACQKRNVVGESGKSYVIAADVCIGRSKIASVCSGPHIDTNSTAAGRTAAGECYVVILNRYIQRAVVGARAGTVAVRRRVNGRIVAGLCYGISNNLNDTGRGIFRVNEDRRTGRSDASTLDIGIVVDSALNGGGVDSGEPCDRTALTV